MNRFFLSSYLFTGRPASIFLLRLTSYFNRFVSPVNSFNKRGGETVHYAGGSWLAVACNSRLSGMPLEYFQGSAQVKIKRTLLFSSTMQIQISLADATR